MALIFCPSCGNQVSDKAEKCIKCEFSIQTRVNPNNSEATKNKVNKPDKDINPLGPIFVAIILCLAFFYLPPLFKKSSIESSIKSSRPTESFNKNENSASSESVQNNCNICGRLFSGSGYTEVRNGVWERCEDPYQCFICSPTCGRKHTDKMNGYVNSTRRDLNDGRVYESSSCGLCKGTGIEKNNAPNLSDEYGRVCPMCDGKGVRGY